MRTIARTTWLLAIAAVGGCARPQMPPLRPDTRSGGRLDMADTIPVVHLYGTPEQMGRQHAALLGPQIGWVYANYLPRVVCGPDLMERAYVQYGGMLQLAPAAYRQELRAMAAEANVPFATAAVAQMFPDIRKEYGLACSSFAAAGEATADGHVLVARNLDFPSFGVLEQATCLQVYHPDGGRPYAIVGYPGLIGAISGVNDRGLAVSTHVVFRAGLRRDAMPYLLLLRRVLAECATAAEALALLKASAHSNCNNYLLADRGGDLAVVEVGPAHLRVRRPQRQIVFCTNYHLDPAAAGPEQGSRCRRMADVADRDRGRIDVGLLQRMLHEVRMPMTVQSMVFDLTAGRLHLASGTVPSTEGPYVRIGLRALFERPREAADHG